MLDALDAPALRAWSRTVVETIDGHREEIDALNVFPVADSDTGANLLATLRAADAALASTPTDEVGTALAAWADGAAVAALGNSGFIASQLLRGLADAAAGQQRCDARTVAAGLDRGAHLARAAVVEPVDGTVLTVARAAADAAVAAAQTGGRLGEVVVAAVAAADAALQRTTGQLAELARAGVVDAGGRGLVLVLDALARTVTATGVPLAPVHRPAHVVAPADADRRYEVQYHLRAPAEALERLRAQLAAIGDSVAVVPTGSPADQTWNVHVHVDDAGAAIEAGVDVGRLHRITVVALEDAGRASGAAADDSAADHSAADRSATDDSSAAVTPEPATVVFAVAPGAGLAHLFEREGARVVAGGPQDLPSVADVVAAITGSGARGVVMLPNAARVTGVAEAAATRLRAAGLQVSVVPTRSAVQGLAAVAVHDPARRFEDDVVAMAEAAAATRYAEVVVATSEALTAVGICQPGDTLGLIDGEVVEIGRGLLAVAFGLIDRLLRVGAELMTVVIGADAPPGAGELLRTHVRGQAPLTDVAVYQGGQHDQPVIIGVE